MKTPIQIIDEMIIDSCSIEVIDALQEAKERIKKETLPPHE